MKTDLFQSCGQVFQTCWHIECSTFTASSFKIWNHSTGIPSPPLALFIVMFPKAHLTSHSRMFGSRWVITPLWLSGSWSSFLYSSSAYSCHLFLMSSASVQFSSFQFSHSVMSDSLRPHESQHTRPPCPSPTPGVHSDSHPSSQWCHSAISSSIITFSSCPQSLPTSGSFPMSQLFTWGGQSTGVFSFSIIPSKEIPGLISFRMDWLDLLAV